MGGGGEGYRGEDQLVAVRDVVKVQSRDMANSIEQRLEFRTARFAIQPNTDIVTGVVSFGRQLAVWLRNELITKGYKPGKVIFDDVGWNVICTRNPFVLCFQCAPVFDLPLDPSDSVGVEVSWACTVKARKNFLAGLFQRIDPNLVTRLSQDLENILRSDGQIEMIEAAGE